jgi:hypothetical protein
MTDTNLLNIAIERSGFKKGYIQKRLGLSATAFWNKVNNISEFKASEIELLTQILNLSARERNDIFFASKVD